MKIYRNMAVLAVAVAAVFACQPKEDVAFVLDTAMSEPTEVPRTLRYHLRDRG